MLPRSLSDLPGRADGHRPRRERQRLRIVADDVRRQRRHVPAGHDAQEVGQRNLLLHGRPQTYIVTMIGVGASVSVAEQAVRRHLVVVWPRLSLDRGTVVMLRGRSDSS